MWDLDAIHIEIELAEHPVMIVNITTPAGQISLLGSVSIVGQILHIDKAHIDGLRPGKLGRAGLNAIGRKLAHVPAKWTRFADKEHAPHKESRAHSRSDLSISGSISPGCALLDVADVEEIIIQGATRSTGKYKGKIPRPIRFRRGKDDAVP
jgi:hypothetical protein